jgi:hypothetical protein
VDAKGAKKNPADARRYLLVCSRWFCAVAHSWIFLRVE